MGGRGGALGGGMGGWKGEGHWEGGEGHWDIPSPQKFEN